MTLWTAAALAASLGLAPLGADAAPPAASPTTERLLLDVATREAFTARHASAFLRVRYRPAPPPGQDVGFQTEHETLGAVVSGPGGVPWVLAPEHLLAGVGKVQLILADGREVPARVVHARDPDEAPLARLEPTSPDALAGLAKLGWAPADAVTTGARGWAIEWPDMGQLPAGARPRPVLVDTELGAEAEHPLERFRTVALSRADGLAVVDAAGRVLCIAYRAVLSLDTLSLCAPRDAALGPLGVASPPAP